MRDQYGPFKIGEHVRSVQSGREYVITRRWRDPGMRSYEYEAVPPEADIPNTFTRGQIERMPT